MAAAAATATDPHAAAAATAADPHAATAAAADAEVADVVAAAATISMCQGCLVQLGGVWWWQWSNCKS